MKRSIALLATGLLAGCAPKVTSPAGQNLIKGVVEPVPSASAIRVGSKANLLNQGKRLKFDVWIEADSSKGRLDALGPFGTPLATVIWEDSGWQAWLPGQATLLRGYGNAVNLPVLGIKDIRPAALIAPLLGRTHPRSGPIKTATGSNSQTVIFPATQNPSWALIVDQNTGLPIRKQTLKDGREIEGLTFHHWRKQGEVLIPGTIDRTTPDGQMLELEIGEWKAIPAIPPEHLRLSFQSPVDTITLGRNDKGQTVYRIRPAGSNLGDSTSVILNGGHGMLEAPIQNLSQNEDDSLSDDGEDDSDSAAVDEGQDETSVDETPLAPPKSVPQNKKPAGLAPDKPTIVPHPKRKR